MGKSRQSTLSLKRFPHILEEPNQSRRRPRKEPESPCEFMSLKGRVNGSPATQKQMSAGALMVFEPTGKTYAQ